jgi:hypothetical protein
MEVFELMSSQKCARPAHRGDGGEPRTIEQLGGQLKVLNTAFPTSAQPRRSASRSIIAAWLSAREPERRALPPTSPWVTPILPRFLDGGAP